MKTQSFKTILFIMILFTGFSCVVDEDGKELASVETIASSLAGAKADLSENDYMKLETKCYWSGSQVHYEEYMKLGLEFSGDTLKSSVLYFKDKNCLGEYHRGKRNTQKIYLYKGSFYTSVISSEYFYYSRSGDVTQATAYCGPSSMENSECEPFIHYRGRWNFVHHFNVPMGMGPKFGDKGKFTLSKNLTEGIFTATAKEETAGSMRESQFEWAKREPFENREDMAALQEYLIENPDDQDFRDWLSKIPEPKTWNTYYRVKY